MENNINCSKNYKKKRYNNISIRDCIQAKTKGSVNENIHAYVDRQSS